MKEITIEQLEKVKESYVIQQQEARTRLVMLDGAIQATDKLIKYMKNEIEMDTIEKT